MNRVNYIIIYLILLLLFSCKNKTRKDQVYDNIIVPILNLEFQKKDSLHKKENNNLLGTIDMNFIQNIRTNCIELDDLFTNYKAKLKSVLNNSTNLFLYNLGFDNVEKQAQANGDPYLDILIICKDNSYKYQLFNCIESDDFAFIKSNDNSIIFTKYDSVVGGTQIYVYDLKLDQLYFTDNLTEKESQFKHINYYHNILKLDYKQFSMKIVEMSYCK